MPYAPPEATAGTGDGCSFTQQQKCISLPLGPGGAMQTACPCVPKWWACDWPALVPVAVGVGAWALSGSIALTLIAAGTLGGVGFIVAAFANPICPPSLP